MQKGSGVIYILIGFLILVGVAGGAYLLGQQNSKQQNPPSQKACTEEAKICPDGSGVGRTGPNCEFAQCPSSSPVVDETAGWKTYTNTQFGFSFDYPTNSEVELEVDTPRQLRLNLKSSDRILTIETSEVEISFSKGNIEDVTTVQNVTWTIIKESQYCGVDCSKGASIYVTKNSGRYYVLILRSIDSSSEIFKKVLSTFQIKGYEPKKQLDSKTLHNCIQNKQQQYSTEKLALESILVKFNNVSLDEAKNIVRAYELEFIEPYSDFSNSSNLTVKVPLGEVLKWVCEFEKNNKIKSAIPLFVTQL